ncbi:protein containing methyltransferase domain [Bacteroidales bacterium 6E]|nr:protein containing methyltransferase domain [Bacteroidales bacterium 6E]
MQDRHLDKEKYFREQATTSRKYVIPYVSSHISFGPGIRVLEIGCGEGGNLKPFLEMGCHVTGVDLSEGKIENGRKFYQDHPLALNLELICEDIYNLDFPDQPFDFIFMRDVIEHIHDQEKFMGFVKRFLASEGCFFLAFPPWHNPFGGHQQICRNRWLAHTPWIHLLPVTLYTQILKEGGEPHARIEALMEIRETGLSLERFEKILRQENYKLLKRDFYLVNPNYEVKFGMKPRKVLPFFENLKYLRNLYTTTAYYLIRR